MNQYNSSTIILFLTPYFRNSKFLTSHSLIFNTARTTYGIPPFAGIRSYVPSLYFVKGLKQNIIWYNCNCTHHITHIFQSRPFSYQWHINYVKQILVFLLTTHFDYYSIFDSPTFLFKNLFQSDPHIVKRCFS